MFPLLSYLFSKSRTFQRYKYICIDIYVEHSQINIYELVDVHLGIHILAVWSELHGVLPVAGSRGGRSRSFWPKPRCPARCSTEPRRAVAQGWARPAASRRWAVAMGAAGRQSPVPEVRGVGRSLAGCWLAQAGFAVGRSNQIQLPPAAVRVFPAKH